MKQKSIDSSKGSQEQKQEGLEPITIESLLDPETIAKLKKMTNDK